MTPLKRTVLSKENAKGVRDKITTFFLKNSSPVHNHLFINCTLRKVTTEKGLEDYCKNSSLMRVLSVTLQKLRGDAQIAIKMDDAGIKNTKHDPEYIFKEKTVFIFTERKLYVKIPCKDYGRENHFRYVIRVFEA